MGDAKALIDHQARLASRRSNFETWWQEIAYRVMPASATFTIIDDVGSKRTERLFTGKAVTANERFASVMDELLTPRSQVWHMLAGDGETDFDFDSEEAEYFERLNKLLFTMRYRPQANFASQKHQGYLDVGAFGNSCLFIDEEVGRGTRYAHIPLPEVYWAENHQGVIDTVYRRFKLDARQALQKWPKGLPPKIVEAATKEPFKEFEFLHCVRPNEERKASRRDAAGMPWASHYVSIDEQAIIATGGYTSWPYAIGRYMLAGREMYARSPAMACWGAILTLNEEKKTVLRAGQRQTEPPLLMTEDGALEPFNMRSGALNPGTLSDSGEPLVRALELGGDVPLGMELMALEVQEIDDSFLVSVFKILAEHPQMTATQVLEITQQKATLLAPVMGRQHSEDLGPLIEREVDIASRMSENRWISEEMPDSLRERMGSFKIEYRSPLARAMRAQDGVAIVRTFEVLPAAISVDKDAALVLDVKAAVRELAEINGVPAKLIRDKQRVEEMMQASAEAEQVAQVAAIAPEMSQAALNAAKAEQLRSGA